MSACPCQSGLPYSSCCAPLHGGAPAASPEALMRSRYSAFALGNTDYLLTSWHPDTRPASLAPEVDLRWYGLDILSSHEDGAAGEVHFRATCRDTSQDKVEWQILEERSRFARIGEHWRYLDGQHSLRRLNPGRNDPCPCGSGRKFKKCCG
ncbi:MAG: SEC-C domain-containing protein [Alcanivorax sp.]|nr:SEC-C domain-containing protein [Alcanivorax sp.]